MSKSSIEKQKEKGTIHKPPIAIITSLLQHQQKARRRPKARKQDNPRHKPDRQNQFKLPHKRSKL